jgi:hypothetical protein
MGAFGDELVGIWHTSITPSAEVGIWHMHIAPSAEMVGLVCRLSADVGELWPNLRGRHGGREELCRELEYSLW